MSEADISSLIGECFPGRRVYVVGSNGCVHGDDVILSREKTIRWDNEGMYHVGSHQFHADDYLLAFSYSTKTEGISHTVIGAPTDNVSLTLLLAVSIEAKIEVLEK